MEAPNTPTGTDRSARLATDTGHFAVLAIDHVRSFAATVRPYDPDSKSTEDIWAAKRPLAETLCTHASAKLVHRYPPSPVPGIWNDTRYGSGNRPTGQLSDQ